MTDTARAILDMLAAAVKHAKAQVENAHGQTRAERDRWIVRSRMLIEIEQRARKIAEDVT